MATAKELLDAATPLPWYSDETDQSWRLHGGVMGEIQILKAPKQHPHQAAYWPKDADALLIEHAVNRLPDYEAAVEALERLLNEYGWTVSEPWENARAALRRLREVTA